MLKPLKSESTNWYGVLFRSDYFPILNSITNKSNDDERLLIYKNLGAQYPFKQSSRYTYDKNYYCASGRMHSVVTVFEVIDVAEQQKIVEAAKEVKKRYATRPFLIEFYDKQTGPFPRDQFLRKVRID
jgi:hypothetical protein